MQIDARTVFWVFMLVQVVGVTVYWLTLRRHPHLKGPGWWASGCLAAMVGFAFILLRGTLPDFTTYTLANALIIGATLCLWAGLRVFFGRSVPVKFLFFVVLLGAGLYHIALVLPSNSGRTIVVSVFNGVGVLFALRELSRQRSGSLAIEVNMLAGLLAIDAFIHLARIVGTFIMPAPSEIVAPSPLDGPFLLAFVVAAIGRLLLFISLISGRLQDELKEAEAQSRASEMRFRSLLESIPALSVQGYGADGTALYWNQASERIYGYSAEEAIGRNLLDLIIPPEMRQDVSAAMEQMFATGVVMPTEELTLMRKDGSRVSVISSHAYVSVPGKSPELFCVDTDISERKATEEQINHLAYYDALTQLPNRRLLMDRLQQVQAARARNKLESALLFIDLDNFKTLNDTLGHDVGDLLLQQVAQRLISSVREGDTVARLGGDEFVVMLEDLSDNATEAATLSEAIGKKILAALNQPYQLDSHEHQSTPSIGVTLFGDYHESLDELLKRGDLAMYQAKAAGRNAIRFFDPAMQTAVNMRAAMEADLRDGIWRNQFRLYYQAQVNAEGRVTGAEALVRWQHPTHGMVSPAEFIPLAEETGLILPLGHWVAETACYQLASWSLDPATAHLTLAVNISARQFKHKHFVDLTQAMILHTGINPSRLKLELTESLLVDDVEGIIAKMTVLKAHGVSFSLDDFGTGYSSLSYLKRLPLDQLKIDQSFVRDVLTDPNDAAIARTVVALAQSLGLEVIAEGVETEAQRDFLANSGCHAYQGYFFSRPLPLEGFEEFVKRH